MKYRGLGCMGMSHGYGVPDDAESIEVLNLSIEPGINFWDTNLRTKRF